MDDDCNCEESTCCECDCDSTCCGEEQTIGEMVTDYIANARQRLEELRERGREGAEQFAELAEQRRQDAGDYLGELRHVLNEISAAAAEEKHIGYLIFTTGKTYLGAGIQKIFDSKPSELNPKTFEGLGRIALYGGETCLGVLTAKVGAITFTIEEAVRYARKRAEEKAAEEPEE